MLQYTFDISTFEYFLLILVRISCFVFVAPFFGAKEVPGRVKVGLSAFVAILVFFAVPMEHTAYTSEIGYAVLVLKEGITGLLIGFAAYICNSIILYAGTIIDMDIGLSMAMVFDPSTGSQVSITGNLYSYFVLLLLIVSNMHQYILRALVDSFRLFPQVLPSRLQVFFPAPHGCTLHIPQKIPLSLDFLHLLYYNSFTDICKIFN